MKKLVLSIAALIVATAASSAHAAKVCDATWHVKGGGLQQYVGFFELKGKGHIDCSDNGVNTSIPVNVKLGGSLLAARSAAGILFMQGTATGLGYTNSPMELMGSYATIQTAGAAYVGVGYSVGLKAANGVAVGTLGVSAVEGLGYQAGFSTVTFSLDTTRQVEVTELR